MREWLYFGCGRGIGHYLFTAGGRSADSPEDRRLCRFDGELAPWPGRELYVAAFYILHGHRRSAISWWDHSVDTRPGSNSIIFSPESVEDAAALLADAQIRFPWVFNRLPVPVKLLSR